jgi:hypothetical protein
MKINLGGTNRKRKRSNNNDIHKSYYSLNIIMTLKLRIIKLAGHRPIKCYSETPEKRKLLENLRNKITMIVEETGYENAG